MSLRVLWRSSHSAEAARALPIPPELDVRFAEPGELSESDLAWAEVLVTGSASPEQLSGPAMKHVVVPFAGVNAKLRAAALATPGVSVHNSHYNAVMVAHHALALLLACTQRVVAHDTTFRRGDWGDDTMPANASLYLPGKVALLLGFGHIGKALVGPLRALGLDVRAWRRQALAEDGVTTYAHDELLEALVAADVVLISLPGTPETTGLLGAAELAAMKSTAVLVNVGRGEVVDEAALYDALANRSIASAGIDVWYDYPKERGGLNRDFPSRFPFQELNNVVMSPHRGNDVADWPRAAALDTLDTLRALARGEMPNLVDLSSGY